MKIRRHLNVGIICVISLLLTGCWDSVEINERHVVLEIAIDKNVESQGQDNQNKDERYKVTYTIPDIGKLSGKDSLAENVKNSIVTNSSTIATSIDEVETKTQNTITFSHTKAIVLGEELLKDKKLFKAAIDGLMRNMEIGRSTNVIAIQGKADELTKFENPENPIFGLYILKYFNNTERPTSFAKQQTLGNMIKELQNDNITTIPMASIIKDDGEEQGGTVLISGAALIKNYELVGWLDKEEIRGILFTQGEVKQAPIVIEFNNEYITYNIEQEKGKIRFQNVNGKYEAIIDILAKGNIIEYTSTENHQIFNEEDINKITVMLEQEINRQIQVTIDSTKKLNVDALNVGLEMYRKHPKAWNEYKASWEQNGYRNIPIKINTTVDIQNTGILE